MGAVNDAHDVGDVVGDVASNCAAMSSASSSFGTLINARIGPLTINLQNRYTIFLTVVLCTSNWLAIKRYSAQLPSAFPLYKFKTGGRTKPLSYGNFHATLSPQTPAGQLSPTNPGSSLSSTDSSFREKAVEY